MNVLPITIPNLRPKCSKSIPDFRPKWLKNHIGTYLYTCYMGVPPSPGGVEYKSINHPWWRYEYFLEPHVICCCLHLSQKLEAEGVGSGPTVSHYAAELLDLRRGMSWTGQIMCGLRCTPNPSRDGFTATPVRTRVINHCFTKLAGERN